ncbi:paramyosin-like, partial [Saccostrea cucullata]|uniref:paramyosin-like n=1 Tax=Saccostrea cuccullata TaxID=36930 RepID=UPI002ED0880B
MKLLSLGVTFLFITYSGALSLLTDNEDSNSTTLIDKENINNLKVLWQMINQETVIRLALVKNVHVLMNDVDSIKQNLVSSDTTVTNLQQTIQTLKTQVGALQQENKRLADDNIRFQKQIQEFQEKFTKVDENITDIYEHQQVTEIRNEEKRQAIFNKTNHILDDVKMEVRYLSVTLLDFKERTEKDTKIKDENIQKIERRLNSTLEYVNAKFLRTEGIFGNFSASLKDMEYSQSETSRNQM